MTDSTTSKGWLRKTNFREENDHIQSSTRIQTARDHARWYMDLEIRDYSQWFPGTKNNVADSLACSFHLTDDKLISYLRHYFPSQIPSIFNIIPLPKEIVSYLTSRLQLLPVNEQFREEHMQTKNSPGNAGINTVHPSDLRQISSLTDLAKNIASKSWEPSQLQCKAEDFRSLLELPWALNSMRGRQSRGCNLQGK